MASEEQKALAYDAIVGASLDMPQEQKAERFDRKAAAYRGRTQRGAGSRPSIIVPRIPWHDDEEG